MWANLKLKLIEGNLNFNNVSEEKITVSNQKYLANENRSLHEERFTALAQKTDVFYVLVTTKTN